MAETGVIGLVQALITGSILLTLTFAIALGRPSGAVGWMLAAWAWVTATFELLLLLSTFRVAVPIWIAASVLLAQDVIFTWRLVLLWRSRQDKGVLHDQ